MSHSGALEAVDRILNRGGAPDEVLRAVVAALHERGFAWAAFVPGPEAGERREAPPLRAPVVRAGRLVAELQAQPGEPAPGDLALLERVALVASPYVRG